MNLSIAGGIWRGKRSGKMIVIKRIPGRGSQTPIAEEKVFPRQSSLSTLMTLGVA